MPAATTGTARGRQLRLLLPQASWIFGREPLRRKFEVATMRSRANYWYLRLHTLLLLCTIATVSPTTENVMTARHHRPCAPRCYERYYWYLRLHILLLLCTFASASPSTENVMTARHHHPCAPRCRSRLLLVSASPCQASPTLLVYKRVKVVACIMKIHPAGPGRVNLIGHLSAPQDLG